MATERPLGRREPTDWRHVDKYPITALSAAETPKGVPVVIGVNWYTDFDRPQRVGNRYLIGRDAANLGHIRGGHCVCIKPERMADPTDWWRVMDQGSEGACVGFGSTRAMMLLNRRRYDAFWLYYEAQKVDEWVGEDYDGTSVRAGMDILRDVGHRRTLKHRTYDVNPNDGIAANRWATSVDDVLTCLNSPRFAADGLVPILNSWGGDYPHYAWMPLDTLQRLLDESGEATIITDR
jgi:hypothetical protein